MPRAGCGVDDPAPCFPGTTKARLGRSQGLMSIRHKPGVHDSVPRTRSMQCRYFGEGVDQSLVSLDAEALWPFHTASGGVPTSPSRSGVRCASGSKRPPIVQPEPRLYPPSEACPPGLEPGRGGEGTIFLFLGHEMQSRMRRPYRTAESPDPSAADERPNVPDSG